MPTYEYACDHCDKHFDVVQSFHDDPLTSCPTCGSPVRKVFGNVGIVFKGSGFYKTDSRNGGAKKKDTEAPTPATTASEGSGSGDGKESPKAGDTTAKDSKPSTPEKSTEKKSGSGTPASAGTAPSS